MKKLFLLVTLVLCLALSVQALAGTKDLAITRVDDATVANLSAARAECVVGNLNPIAYSITDWVYGLEAYKYLFDPTVGCDLCQSGLVVREVHFLLNFGVEDVPATFSAYADVEESIWDAAIGCLYPGPEICVSDPVEFTVDTEGLYDFSIPIVCECMEVGYPYFLSFHFTTEFPETGRPDIITDEAPLGCVSWNDYGTGWFDLVNDFDLPGEIIMWADADCCEDPVATETKTWGDIKSLYR